MTSPYVPPDATLDGPHPWAAYGLTGVSWATWSPPAIENHRPNAGKVTNRIPYRYTLGRTWNTSAPRLVFVGLNPSTADAHAEDPTIRKLVAFAVRWGLGGLDMLNLFAFRSTDPRGLPDDVDEAAGPSNMLAIATLIGRSCGAGNIIAFGWGIHGAKRDRWGRAQTVLDMGRGVAKCFGWTKNRMPKHPLYLPYDTRLISI